MFNQLFTRSSGSEAAAANAVYAPMSGTVVLLEQVPDPVFSGRMLGDGVAILPAAGDVLAPFDGEVTALFPTGHAIGLCSHTGVECLIHIGIDTVEMNDVGFAAKVKPGDKVKQGQLLIQADLQAIRSAGKEIVTPVIITNSSVWQPAQLVSGQVRAGSDMLFTVNSK